MISTWIDFLFPPFCLSCQARSSTPFLCPDCWILCKPPDPIERCRHCFEELDREGSLCQECSRRPYLPVSRAYVFDPDSPASLFDLERIDGLAGFAAFQFIQLDGAMPSAIVPMPDNHSLAIGRVFASLFHLPLIRALKWNLEYRCERLEEGETILLFDVHHSIANLRKGALALSESFPKRITILSLFG